MAGLRMDRVSKSFGSIAALQDISWQAEHGHLLVILGQSGAGKTTIIRALAGLECIDCGEIYLDDRRITTETPARRDLAVVFQNFSLYPHLNVAENLAFPLRARWRKLSEAEIQERVHSAAEMLHITPWLDRKPFLLSGGQMQRVAIGRAIVRSPQVFLMDEPLTNLDAKLREELRFELKTMQRRLQTTTIFVTHDPLEAMSLADRLIVMDKGRILQQGSPSEVYARPAHRKVGALLGTPPMNFLEARLENGQLQIEGSVSPIRLQQHEYAPAHTPLPVVVGIRSEDLRLRYDGTIQARCEAIEFFGAEHIVLFKTGRAILKMACTEALTLRAGDEVRLSFDPERLHLFSEAGQRLN